MERVGDIIEVRGVKYRINSIGPATRIRLTKGSKRLGRKESQIECPLCARPVGGRHTDECPRSMKSLRALPKPEKRMAYLSMGVGLVSGPDGSPRVVRNPGFPYVRPRKGVSWTAGGLPLGFDKKSALAYMQREAERAAQESTITTVPPIEPVTPTPTEEN